MRAPQISLVLALLIGAISPSLAVAAIPAREKANLESILREDLTEFRKERRTDFRALVDKWERVYGGATSPFLLKIAKDGKAKDSDRYVALLAHSKIQGPKSAEDAKKLLDDKNWMVRSAALKSIEVLGYAPAAPKVLEMLAKDPALVIRTQSIDTLKRLRPEGLADALVKAAMDSKNYRPGNYKTGRADWVPQKALEALREIKPEGYAKRLLPLLNDAKDGRVRAHALHTIEALEGKTLKKGRPFAERAVAWNQALKR
jgi:hypothetical protein